MAFSKNHTPWNKGKKGKKPYMNTAGLLLGHQTGEKNHIWKGNKAGYSAIHYWVQRQMGKAKVCEKCGSTKKCVWANISGSYKREISDYKPLCFSCHFYFDNVGQRMWQTRRGVAYH